MPICPNCRSYVSEGSPVCGCGTTLSRRPEEKVEEDPKEIKRRELAREYYLEACSLEREPENVYDSDAIAFYSGERKVGYVANSRNTVCDLTSLASELDIPRSIYAKYLMRYDFRFHIAQITCVKS